MGVFICVENNCHSKGLFFNSLDKFSECHDYMFKSGRIFQMVGQTYQVKRRKKKRKKEGGEKKKKRRKRVKKIKEKREGRGEGAEEDIIKKKKEKERKKSCDQVFRQKELLCWEYI